MIDPIALRSLVALADKGSVHAAAASLDYTPSAVSQQIKRLQAESGTSLVERVGRRLVLTGAGRTLVDEASSLLQHMESVEARVRASSGQAEGTLRVAAFSTALRGLVPSALPAVAGHAPAVELRWTEIDPWESVDAVARGLVDVGIVHNWEPVPLDIPSHVDVTILGTDHAEVLLPADHPLAAEAALKPEQLIGHPWVSVARGSICHQWLTWLFGQAGGTPAIMHEVLEYETQMALVSACRVLALIPRLGRGPLPDGVVTRPLAEPAKRTIMLVHRRSLAGAPGLEAVRAGFMDAGACVLDQTCCDESPASRASANGSIAAR